jgi:hypothetical protein
MQAAERVLVSEDEYIERERKSETQNELDADGSSGEWS